MKKTNFFIMQYEWVSVGEKLPTGEDYYKVKFTDGSEDEKPFRIRPTSNIYGFMTEKEVTHWKDIPLTTIQEEID